MHHSGLDVWGCDLPSPPRDFLQWRAVGGGYHRPILDPGSPGQGVRPGVLWIIDTLDHLPDPEAELGGLLNQVDLVINERYEVDQRRGRQGFHFRRTPPEITHLFALYGLQPRRPAETPEVLSIWARARPECTQPLRPELDGATRTPASGDPHLRRGARSPGRDTGPTSTEKE